ncbi:MAG: DUF3179 domain-containing (seleno)protein [Actinomycetota bacterium]
MLRILLPLLFTFSLIAAACSSTSGDSEDANPTPTVDISEIETGELRDFGPPPEYPDGPWPPETGELLGAVVAQLSLGDNPEAQLAELGETGDARVAWALADLQRFVVGPPVGDSVNNALEALLGIEIGGITAWGDTIDALIAWDIPVPDGYFTFKRDFYSRVDPRWEPLFTDFNTIDWRYVSWGGVLIDDREPGDNGPCNCIPALDDPVVTPAADGDWYPDERIVFGVVINDEARAYPKNIMEVHEMVNDTLGGRRIGIPYCTLCGSAQAYLTDELDDETWEQPTFRTSGFLIRSNKMMYEVNTQSFIDTFTGAANSGPMAEAGVTFNQVSVITTTWAEWKEAHPDTTIVAEDGGIGRSYELDPLGGRDDNGPIFPIGPRDPRLPVQEPVLGVFTEDGTPVAFHVGVARDLLEAGERVVVDDIELELDGGGVRAVRADGSDAGGHQAFWFAWSQFRPRTQLWPHDYQPEDAPEE